MNADILHAARQIHRAEAILVGAGAGMGVDSGLPDFRGDEGFWRAYPPLERLGLSFVNIANPAWLEADPRLAWGFYGHRLHLYRDTVPHEGFYILRRWIAKAGNGFVFTSNVDGQFQKAGYAEEDIVECHGSLHHLQCARCCSRDIWPAMEIHVSVDPDTFQAADPLPGCPRCGGLARPNVLMFGDGDWHPERTAVQEVAFRRWLATVRESRLVIVECGAGRAVPTVRNTCEAIARDSGATLIRINPRELEGPSGTISIAEGALATLTEIDRAMDEMDR
uniref:protein acetyllysine N-acetyltransferase n=1 Tax=Candidatus Kentrum sp. TUN TaxID=2126343 RepID=A0A451A7C1_9GAMM|nr:MAG: NAD-dependent protein deacetylase, SIR2 family [Candidatus Kentron sp. TUN]VFK52426.1 MAG: NAD-dependent protein deacetylase, SIR2 family [Candidatus Kentron sp. TUN]VFK61925.1 MAG: NAD-dependent protein deacetylase, SIR2 family [Candidatus Kentron sp. TUN]